MMNKLDSMWWHEGEGDTSYPATHAAVFFCALYKNGWLEDFLLDQDYEGGDAESFSQTLTPMQFFVMYADGEIFDSFIKKKYRKPCLKYYPDAYSDDIFETNAIGLLFDDAKNVADTWQNVDILVEHLQSIVKAKRRLFGSMKKWIDNYDEQYSEELNDLCEGRPLAFRVKKYDIDVVYRLHSKIDGNFTEILQLIRDLYKDVTHDKADFLEGYGYLLEVRVQFKKQKITKKWFDDLTRNDKLVRSCSDVDDEFEMYADIYKNQFQKIWDEEMYKANEEEKLKIFKKTIDESGVLWLHDYPVEEAQLMQSETSRLSDLLHYDFSIRFEYFVANHIDDEKLSIKITKEFVKAIRAETNCIVKNRYGLVVITTPAQRLQKETFLDAKKTTR